jgi:hypothetical protein
MSFFALIPRQDHITFRISIPINEHTEKITNKKQGWVYAGVRAAHAHPSFS